MAELTRETIVQLKRLCRIETSEEEEEALLRDLKSILEYFKQLDELDTDGVPPCNCVLEELSNVMREDEVGVMLSREAFLANAPAHTGGMVKVPTVIQRESQ